MAVKNLDSTRSPIKSTRGSVPGRRLTPTLMLRGTVTDTLRSLIVDSRATAFMLQGINIAAAPAVLSPAREAVSRHHLCKRSEIGEDCCGQNPAHHSW